MDVYVEGENLGYDKKQDKFIEKCMTDGEDFEVINPELRVFRNKRNPNGFIINIENGEEIHSIRITTESMKFIIKHVIDEL